MKVLFVCLGNICRSPTAEGVFRHYVEQAGLSDKITIDSAGTSDWHLGKTPDPRTVAAAAQRGYDVSTLRGRQVTAEDFAEFDLILAMDKSNLSNLQAIQPAASKAELALYLPRFGISLMKCLILIMAAKMVLSWCWICWSTPVRFYWMK